VAKLDLDWLPVFVQVFRTRSVSRAAEYLDMSQGSASATLNKLRRHFGDPLFTRTSTGMEPTPRATAIFPQIVDALEHLRSAQGQVDRFVPEESRREFRLCMTDISEIVLLPTLVNHLQKVAPRVSIEAERISTDSRRRLESGEVDLAVGFMPDLEAGFYQQALFAQDFVCLASSQHPRIASKLTRAAFLAEGHLVVTTSGTGHSIVTKVLDSLSLERRVVLKVPSFLGVGRIVAATDLLVVVPRLLGEELALLHPVQLLRPPVELPSYKVKQHWHSRFNGDTGNAWLRATVAELFSRGGVKKGRLASHRKTG
jgi:DNA-binding transcriptional LysR family regulator